MSNGNVTELRAEDFQSYLELREAIDSFAMVAKEFYAQAPLPDERRFRAQAVKTYVFEFIRDLYGESDPESASETMLGCPSGSHYNGVWRCIPDTLSNLRVQGTTPDYGMVHGEHRPDPCE